MTVAPTSRWAYEAVDLGARQAEVAEALRELGEASDLRIAGHLGWSINRVTPRRGELVVLGLVVRSGLTEGPYGQQVSLWRLVMRQGDLFEERKSEVRSQKSEERR